MDTETLDLLENKLIIRHKHFEEVFNKILRSVQYGRSDEPTCIFGPTGIGKTTIQNFSISEFIIRQNNGWRSDYGNPVMIEVPPQNSNTFPWKDFIEDILIALGDTDLRCKKDLDAYQRNKIDGRNHISLRPRIGKLESILRKRIKAIKPVCIFFDESQNIVEGLPKKEQKVNVNRIKNWANTMETKFLMLGTHEARWLLNINEQLSRRIVPIYFPRYRRHEPDEYKHFSYFFGNLVRELDLNFDPTVLKSFSFIYNHSLGCPGLLSTWLHQCISYCIDKKISKITMSNMRKHKMENHRLRTIEQAIKNFESYYDSTKGDFNPNDIFSDDLGQLDLGLPPAEISPSKSKPKKNQFKRKPSRYKRLWCQPSKK